MAWVRDEKARRPLPPMGASAPFLVPPELKIVYADFRGDGAEGGVQVGGCVGQSGAVHVEEDARAACAVSARAAISAGE